MNYSLVIHLIKPFVWLQLSSDHTSSVVWSVLISVMLAPAEVVLTFLSTLLPATKYFDFIQDIFSPPTWKLSDVLIKMWWWFVSWLPTLLVRFHISIISIAALEALSYPKIYIEQIWWQVCHCRSFPQMFINRIDRFTGVSVFASSQSLELCINISVVQTGETCFFRWPPVIWKMIFMRAELRHMAV